MNELTTRSSVMPGTYSPELQREQKKCETDQGRKVLEQHR